MSSLFYNFRDVFSIQIHGLSRWAIADLDQKYRWFAGEPHSKSAEKPNIEVTLEPFEIDKRGCLQIDHQYFIKEDQISFEEYSEVFYRVEIKNLNTDHMQIKFYAPVWNRRHLSHLFAPNYILHNYILHPLLEWKLSQRGLFFIHGAAVTYKGKTHLFCGRGNSYKTTLGFNLVRQGASFFGDDLILFDGKKIYPFPIHSRYFSYYLHKNMATEKDLTLFEKLQMPFYLSLPHRPCFEEADPSTVNELFLLHPRLQDEAAQITTCERDLVIEKTFRNNQMEYTNAAQGKQILGKFLQAYEMVFPQANIQDMWDTHHSSLKNLLGNTSTHLVTYPSESPKSLVDVILGKLGTRS